jgi:hypothetical protein
MNSLNFLNVPMVLHRQQAAVSQQQPENETWQQRFMPRLSGRHIRNGLFRQMAARFGQPQQYDPAQQWMNTQPVQPIGNALYNPNGGSSPKMDPRMYGSY